MKILLVNDDGINHNNLNLLENSIKRFSKETLIVAPSEEQSAKSMSMTLGEIEYKIIDKNKYAVKGTPVDCINFALSGLKFFPDLVISGVNEGPNLGGDLMYSGTVGACVQAKKYKIPSIAISKSYESKSDLDRVLEKVFNYVFENKLLSVDHIININLPYLKKDSEIKLTNVYFFNSNYNGVLNKENFIFGREIINDAPPNSDVYEYQKGHITVSKISLDYNL